MPELLLDSLEIKGYRCFDHLRIEKLGRVNLIVGKNNVGKTALLEALWIYSDYNYDLKLSDILLTRNEMPSRVRETGMYQGNDTENYRHLFARRPHPQHLTNDFLLGDIDFEIGSATDKEKILSVSLVKSSESYPPELKPTIPKNLPRFETYFIRSNGLMNKEISDLWDNIQLRESEDSLIEALKPLNDNLISVRFIEYPPKSGEKIPVARLKEQSSELGENPSAKELLRIHKKIDYAEPVPLKSLGEGMSRLFGIALALVNCKNGILIIDEIEIGLHYSVLPDIWKLIFKTAADLNIQVFATTHSKDCLESFAEAAEKSTESGMLIRLENRNGKIIAKTIEENRLELAIEHDVEVR